MTDVEVLDIINQAKHKGWTHLDLRKKGLTRLPPEIAQLAQLKALSVSHNQLSKLPPEIAQLAQLIELDVSNNQLSTLPPEIGQFAQLTYLDVFFNQLSTLPPEIAQLAQLTYLDVSLNQLSTLPPEIAQLAQLTRLYVSHNQLSMLPPEIAQLAQLTELSVSNNQLSTLPPEIAQLAQLQMLSVYNNQLRTLPPEIGQLAQLTELSVYNNQLRTLPPEIGQLAQLTRLYVSNNQLSTLPLEIAQLAQLQTLYMSNNQLSTLPPELWQLPKLENLDARGNPLPVPPEVLDSEKDKFERPKAQPLLREYADIMRNGAVLNEARLIVVGEARAGKTSLLKQLLGEAFNPNEDSTHGVFIRQLTVPSAQGEIRVNAWDFGGQDIYKSTHQFFLSERAVYLLVLNAEQNEQQNRVSYWLNLIQSYGRGAPVIVVLNKSESYRLNLDERRYRLDFEAIAAPFICASAKTGAGLNTLREVLQQQVCGLLHVHTRLYARHVQVKKRLQGMNKGYIPFERFVEICEEEGIQGEDRQRWLLRLLNDLGAAVAFDDEALAGKHVLNPEWVTEGVYQLLTHASNPLRVSQARALLDRQRYPADTPHWLLQLMHKFELCYPLDGNGSDTAYLLLDKLPNKTPAAVSEWEGREALRFEYRYAALPGSVITRLIARMHPFLHGEPWLTGAFFANSAAGQAARNTALVYADLNTNAIYLAVGGNEATRREFLAALCAQLEHIHRNVNLTPEAYVPVPSAALAGKKLERKLNPIRYDDLLEAEKDGERDYYVPGAGRIPLHTLLAGVRVEVTPQALREALQQHFSKDELRALLDDLGVDDEDIFGDAAPKGRATKDTVRHFKQRDQFAALLARVRQLRPGAI